MAKGFGGDMACMSVEKKTDYRISHHRLPACWTEKKKNSQNYFSPHIKAAAAAVANNAKRSE